MASISKRNGKYLARWREYPGGPQTTKTFIRKVDAEQHLVKVQHDLLTGSYVAPEKGRTTLEEYYGVWAARQPWRASSRASIGSIFKHHVLPTFGPRPLGTIRRGDVEAWAAGLRRTAVRRKPDAAPKPTAELAPLAGTTARLAVQYLGTLLESAVADGLLASNPVARAKRPRVETTPVVPFTPEEVERLREAAPDWFRVALTLGAAVGLRQGEATGLSADSVNFLGRTLTVDRQLVTPNAGVPAFGPLKTSRSYRSVPLADVAVVDLARHLEQFGRGEGGVLLHLDGVPVSRQRFGHVWRMTRKGAGLPAARFHDARHTFASTLLSGGVSVAAAADYLGHSPAVLLRTYAHLIPADHDRARAVVQAAFADPAEDSLRTGEGA